MKAKFFCHPTFLKALAIAWFIVVVLFFAALFLFDWSSLDYMLNRGAVMSDFLVVLLYSTIATLFIKSIITGIRKLKKRIKNIEEGKCPWTCVN